MSKIETFQKIIESLHEDVKIFREKKDDKNFIQFNDSEQRLIFEKLNTLDTDSLQILRSKDIYLISEMADALCQCRLASETLNRILLSLDEWKKESENI